MKKIILSFLLFTPSLFQAQEISEALRYAQDNLNGTARFSAMSGAFGALGGDLSSLNVNPAGSAIFNNNQIATTLSNFNTKNNATYFGNSFLEKNNSVDLNQAGVVFVFKNQDAKSDWKKFSLAINYENKNNFDNKIVSFGTNLNNSSIDQYFLHYANADGGISATNLELQGGETDTELYDFLGSRYGFGAQQAFLGYFGQGYIIDKAANYNESTNRQYTSLVPDGDYFHENEIVSNGYNGKITFNGATSFKDKIYLGLNLNVHFIDYTQNSSFYEENNAPLTANYTVSRLRFDNELYTFGNGFSFQLGAIAKATKEIRVGLSYESPTYYSLSDQLSQRLNVVSENISEELPTDSVAPIGPTVYEPYTLQTPGKLTGSFAYIFGKTGLLSLDYAIRDYSNMKFKPNNDFNSINAAMANLLSQTGELRIGGEYKIKQWSLRGGYRFEQSPYKNKTTMGDLTGYSGGLGYNFGSTKLDFSYSTAKRDSYQGFFSQGFTDGSTINTQNNNVSLSLVFEL